MRLLSCGLKGRLVPDFQYLPWCWITGEGVDLKDGDVIQLGEVSKLNVQVTHFLCPVFWSK